MNIRQFKKRYYLCKDDFGNRLYPGDTVEIKLSFGNKYPYQSLIYWNRLDGAFIDQHPSSTIFNRGSHDPLRSVLKQKPFFYSQASYEDPDSDEKVAQHGYIKKIKSTWNTHKK